MGKKVREYKSGDFIFAKVKGYPAWPARVQRLNGKKYFVYFYGTGEIANLPPTMIFDYEENKDKFLNKTVKRRDFNEGVRQIEHDFANNVPLEQVIGVPVEAPTDTTANDTMNDSTANDTMDETGADTTIADESMAEDTRFNTSSNNTAVEDSDDTGSLVIDERTKAKKGKTEVKTPAKPVKVPKTPKAKGKKEEQAKEDEEEPKKEEEIISRSGRKIRPKRYIDEESEDNATLPSPAPKKRRGASPTPLASDKDKEKSSETKEKEPEKKSNAFNAVSQSELEDLKEPFKPEDTEKENLLITYLPSGQYVGIKLFQSRPNSFKNEGARLQWDKQAASNAVTLKMQLEKGQITSQSVMAQLVTDLNLTDEEKATLDKERETEEKRSRVQFLKTEMKLIELDAKIKTCLCLEKADTDLCVKLLDELTELNVKPLMLLKHPTCLETIKRMRAYIGNTSSWDLSENAAILFNKQAQKIRRQADVLYKNYKELFTTPDGLSFWEYFTERVLQFKKVTANLSADELLEMIHEPIEMTMPTTHTMKAAIEAANEEEKESEKSSDDAAQKKKSTPVKTKKTTNNTQKSPLKRQTSKKQDEKDKETQKEDSTKSDTKENSEETEPNIADTAPEIPEEATKPVENTKQEPEKEVETATVEKKADDKEEAKEEEPVEKETEKSTQESDKEKDDKEGEPRAKRSRESKKTEPPPLKSPAKRKSKS